MKKHPAFLVFSISIFFSSLVAAYGQDTSEPKVTGAFDSIEVKDIKALGKLSGGAVLISMQVHNGYATPAEVHFALGGEENFSIEDDKGIRYKIFTSEDLLGAGDINKGFHNVSSLYFGGEKSSSFMYARQQLKPGEAKLLSVQISGVNKGVRTFREFHIRCRRSTGRKMDKETLYRIENIPVNWVASKTK